MKAVYTLVAFQVLIYLIICAGCSSAPESRNKSTLATDEKARLVKIKELLGEEIVGILMGTTKTEPYRVNPESIKFNEEKPPMDKLIGEYLITETGKEQGENFTIRLAAVLTSEETYDYPKATKCFEPGVAYRMWKGPQNVAILICFHCNNISVMLEGAPGEKPTYKGGSFDQSSRTRLLRLAKEAFPSDPKIQEIPEESEKFKLEVSKK